MVWERIVPCMGMSVSVLYGCHDSLHGCARSLAPSNERDTAAARRSPIARCAPAARLLVPQALQIRKMCCSLVLRSWCLCSLLDARVHPPVLDSTPQHAHPLFCRRFFMPVFCHAYKT